MRDLLPGRQPDGVLTQALCRLGEQLNDLSGEPYRKGGEKARIIARKWSSERWQGHAARVIDKLHDVFPPRKAQSPCAPGTDTFLMSSVRPWKK